MIVIEELQELITFLQVIIGIGAAARITYCFIKKSMDDEGKEGYNKRIKNAVIFTVVAELATAVISLIQSYF